MSDKIEKANVYGILELSMVQKGMLFLYLREMEESLYNVQLAFNIEGSLNVSILEQAINHLQLNNEALRSVFTWDKVKKPLQIILKKCPIEINYHDLTNKPHADISSFLEEFIVKDRAERFSLTAVPIRFSILKTGSKKHVLIITHHHILYDGWSTGILLKELFDNYTKLINNTTPETITKPSYLKVKETRKNEIKVDRSKNYWENYLKEYGITSLFTNSIEVSKKREAIQKIGFTYEMEGLESFAGKHKVTTASIIYAVYGILLNKYMNTSDVVFGTTVSDRDSKIRGMEQLVGNFINTLPLRLNSFETSTILEIIKEVNAALIERNEFNHTSYPEIKELLQLKPEDSLFDSVVVIENYPIDAELGKEGGLAVELKSAYENTDIPLLITVFFKDKLEVEFAFKPSAIGDMDVQLFGTHFKGILNEVLLNANIKTGELDLLTSNEKNKVLNEFNDTKADYPIDKTIVDLFEEQVAKTPNNIALRYDGNTITYEELNDQANKIAYYLTDTLGIKVGEMVGLMLERENMLIPAIYGILKSGGVYVPIDPDYPTQRIEAIIEGADINHLITRGKFLKEPISCKGIIDLDQSLAGILKQELKESFKIKYNSNNIAYVIHTSGSTGKPKGVMIEHHSVLNRILWMQKQYPISKEDVLLQKTPVVFDVSVWELFWWSFTGASLYLLKPHGEKDPQEIIDAIKTHSVTTMHFVPSMLGAFLSVLDESFDYSSLKSLKHVFTSGEALKIEQVRTFGETINKFCKTRLINLYGPTEATVDVSYYECSFEEHSPVPIGMPIDNIRLYVLDKNHQPVPIGVPGELCIAGVGLARGYLGNKELTDEKFIKSPHIEESKIYKTGDLVKWLPDGNIHFFGRIDDQVKLRGFRIELGEIETALSTYEEINETAVIVKEVGKDKYLIAYYVAEDELDQNKLKRHLLSVLPVYMMPTYFVHLKALPTNSNGKLDRKALPQPIISVEEDYVGASNETEEKLVKIWQEVLNREEISIVKNFFDVGGDSLKLITVSSRIKQVLNKELLISDLFNNPTISDLAEFIDNKEKQQTDNRLPLKRKTDDFDNSNNDIAIIGMSGRFPGAKNIAEFWDNLQSGKESITRNGAKKDDSSLVNAKGFLDEYDAFDANFFDYLPFEAEVMDPQIRVFHECTWEALEDAGYNPNKYEGAIGLYAGASPNPFFNINITDGHRDNWVEQWESLTYADKDFLASRVSYKLNLKGPSVNLTTACSTSLVAVDTACNDLLSDKCDMAIAGGVSVTLHDNKGYVYQKGMILSPDGKCRAFDKNSAGTVGGNGVGVVILKKLKNALADGDVIHAVIKGSATNNDGNQKVGFTAPSVDGQASVIQSALEKASVDPESISYIEAHGTGTSLGDPIELAGLTKAFKTDKKQFCAIGSVKTNVGHLDAAAGVTGLIKTVLSLKNTQLVPSLHYTEPNPNIDFGNSPFYVNTELKNWESSEFPRRAGVSSFGIGGTNAHVIVEESPERSTSPNSNKEQMVILSAKTKASLEGNTKKLISYLEQNQKEKLTDIAYTLQLGRKHFPFRKAVVGSTNEEVIKNLTESLNEDLDPATNSSKRAIAFMFTGQGSQYVNMCGELYEKEPIFRDTVDECFKIVLDVSGKDIKPIIFPEDESVEVHQLDNTEYTQPALFIMEYAVAQLLIQVGIKPSVMIGHSIGEYVAACIGGVFSLKTALTLVVKRGELMQKTPKGAMLSITTSKTELSAYLKTNPDISLAAINSSNSCVVSGTEKSIDAFQLILDKAGLKSQRVRTSHAFHSYMMDDILEEFNSEVQKVEFSYQRIPFISNLTGKEARNEDITQPEYWVNHLRHEVRFSEGIEVLLNVENTIFLELGPGNTLSTFVRTNQNRSRTHKVISLVRHPKHAIGDVKFLFQGINEMWLEGVDINWAGFHKDELRRKVSLPTYSFEKTKFADRIVSKQLKDSSDESLTRESDIRNGLYMPTWKRIPAAAQVETVDTYLLFEGESKVLDSFKKKLDLEKSKYISVKSGAEYAEAGNNKYVINPDDEQDFKLLFENLSDRNFAATNIVYGWTEYEESERDFIFQNKVNSSLSGFTNLLKTGNETGYLLGKHITVITYELQDVLGDERCSLNAAALVGMLKVIPQEYLSVTVSHIDTTLSDSDMDILLHNQIDKKENGAVIALRKSRVWAQSFEHLSIANNSGKIQGNGVYLITGGSGHLGCVLAEYLLKTYNAKVALLGRSELFKSNGKVNDISESVLIKQERIKRLENVGGELLYLSCDTGQKNDLISAVEVIEKQFGEINGVIHAAGIVEGNSIDLISNLKRTHFEEQMRSKILGLHTLYEVFGHKQLDFGLIISSISSFLGGLKFGAYAAANAKMDYYFNHLKEKDQLADWTLVNLDGVAFEDPNSNGIKTSEIHQVFEDVLSYENVSQIIVSLADVNRRLEQWVSKEVNKKSSAFEGTSQKIIAEDKVEAELTKLWQQFFGISDIKKGDDFFELGGDSLKVLTMSGKIHKIFNVELSLSDFFEHPTLKGISERIKAILKNTGQIKDQQIGLENFNSIPKAKEAIHYPLSSIQKRLYFLQQFDNTSIAYNMPLVLQLNGILDKQRLNNSFQKLIQRHESLRTCFELVDDEPRQRILEEYDFSIEYHELKSEAAHLIDNFIRPFDLAKAPLIRVGLIDISEDNHLLMVDLHHIVTDALSKSVIVNDFASFYKGEDLKPLQLQYKDYAVWQNSEVQEKDTVSQKEFWLGKFKGEIPTLELPTDFKRPLIKTHKGDIVSFEINRKATNQLRLIAKKEGATMYMVILSVYYILLSKLTNSEEIVIGTPVAGRQHSDLENIVGMFVNMLPLKNNVKGEYSYQEFLTELKANVLMSLENHAFQYETLIDELQLPRSTNRNPLFDVAFSYENFEKKLVELSGLTIKSYEDNHVTAKFDLTLIAMESDGVILLKLEYSSDLFSRETVQRFANYFSNIVNCIVDSSDDKVSAINFLPLEEKQQLVYSFNNTVTPYPSQETVVNLFDRQVESTPDQIAIKFKEGSWTFKEVKMMSEKVAAYLEVEYKVSTGDIIGILLGREELLIPLILGVLKCGAAYVPIDTNYPLERINSIIEHSKIKCLITRSEMTNHKLDLSGELINLDKDWSDINGYDGGSYQNKSLANELAYVIYTSGSTGKPKGVLIEHRSLLNYINWSAHYYLGNQRAIFPLFSSISFDLTITSIFTPLISGGCIKIFNNEDNGLLIEEVIKDEEVNIIKLTPTHLRILKDIQYENKGKGSSKKLIVGGEDLPTSLAAEINKMFAGNIKIYNEYGPTESTVGCMIYQYNPEEECLSVPIGGPINNSQIYLLDKYLSPVSVGAIGEIYISGDGLARGYLYNEKLTKDKFVPNPFLEGKLMYKSGDLAIRRNDGHIVFKGRTDDQIKIRGFRIELGEIENSILAHEAISEAIVVVNEKSENKYLVAYYVSDQNIDSDSIRNFISMNLPEYMVPSYYVQLKKLPLTTNGKLDKALLPEPDVKLGNAYMAPKTKEERLLIDVWSKVLGVDNIGITDNFFSLGGDSIKSIQIISRLRGARYELSVKDIFTYQNIKGLSSKLKPIDVMSDQAVVKGEIPLTSIQKWLLDGAVVNKHHFNQSVMLDFDEVLSKEDAESIFKKLQEHHDALRIVFKQEEGQIIQWNEGTDLPVSVEEFDLQNDPKAEATLIAAADRIQSGIDLDKGPLIKLGLFQINNGSKLLIVIHHLVVDGVSWRIIFEDIDTLYYQLKNKEALSLPLKTDSYQLWSNGLADYIHGNNFRKASKYWQHQLAREAVSITPDHPEGSNKIENVETATFKLSKGVTNKLLKKANTSFNTQVNDLLLSALLLAIKKQYDQQSIIIDLEGHGREDILEDLNISRTVGWFTSIYPVILESLQNKLSETIKQVKETLRQVPNNGIDYLMLGNGLDGSIKKSKSQISFNYLGQFDADTKSTFYTVSQNNTGKEISSDENREYDWELISHITDGELQMKLRYSANQYEKVTIASIMDAYKRNLTDVIDYCCKYGKSEITPSDLAYKELSLDALYKIQQQYDVEDVYPLSPMQEGMLFHSHLNEASDQYFEQMNYSLQGDLNLEAVEKSLNDIIARYAVLRTVFLTNISDRSLQIVLRERKVDFSYIDVRAEYVDNSKDELINRYKANDRSAKFDLSNDVLMRVTILHTAANEYEFIWSHHHIIMDGWCMGIIVQDFKTLYDEYIAGTPIKFVPEKPYSKFIEWLERKDQSDSLKYWSEYLASYDTLTTIAQKDSISSAKLPFNQASIEYIIDELQTAQINKISREYGVTLNSVIQTIWGCVLARYNNTNDVVFGAVVSGRPSEIEGVESMVGLFINTIPVRVAYTADEGIDTLLKRTQKNALESEKHQNQSLPEIQSQSDLGNGLLDHILIFENYPISKQIEEIADGKDAGGYRVTNISVFEQTNYDLTLFITPGEKLHIRFDFNTNKYDKATIEQLSVHFGEVLDQMVNNTLIKLSDIRLVSQKESQLILEEFNNTAKEVQRKTINQIFEETVIEKGTSTAIVFENESISYNDLNERSNQVARRILSEGFKKEDIIGIIMPRSTEMIISILGVLKAGCAYVPLDPNYPIDRVKFIIDDSNVGLLLTNTEFLQVNNSYDGVKLIDVTTETLNESTDNLNLEFQESNLAYLIYTSGSTGNPKGVMIEHKSVVNFVEGVVERIPFKEHNSILCLTTISFDIFVLESILPLLSGLKVVLASSADQKDGGALIDLINNNDVDLLQMTPSHLKLLMSHDNIEEAINKIKILMVGGEAFPMELLDETRKLYSGKIYNMYGPTETTVWSAIQDLTLAKSVNIGTPIANTTIRIVNGDNGLQPIGVAGELCIGGEGLARGYWNNKTLTDERFIQDPYKKEHLMYRTGDLARWLPDGTIECLGRMDNQVKIRGFRIELGEIESRLTAHADIKESVVIAKEKRAEKFLIGYYVSDETLDLNELKDHLSVSLPDYMIPAYFVHLEELPLTPNGKINRRALPDQDISAGQNYVAPTGEIEEELARIWSELLQIDKEKISVTSNFFDIGGHSLKATLMVTKIFKELNVEIPLLEIFDLNTISKLSDFIENEKWLKKDTSNEMAFGDEFIIE